MLGWFRRRREALRRTRRERAQLAGLLRQLGGFDGLMPSTDAPDAEWDAWITAQQFESAVVGLASRPPRGDDTESVLHLRSLLREEDLRTLLGPHLDVAEQLVDALARRVPPPR